MTHLVTDRLVLRHFDPTDLDELIALDTDPEVMRYLTLGVPRTVDEIRESLTRFIAAYPAHPGFGFFAAEEKPTGEFVGWFHFRHDREFEGAIEIGYRLKRTAWGRGLATDGSRALVTMGIEEQGVTWITGRCMEDNTASANVLRKCGLRLAKRYIDPNFPGEHIDLLFERRLEPSGEPAGVQRRCRQAGG